jgi:hypothetical protein
VSVAPTNEHFAGTFKATSIEQLSLDPSIIVEPAVGQIKVRRVGIDLEKDDSTVTGAP